MALNFGRDKTWPAFNSGELPEFKYNEENLTYFTN